MRGFTLIINCESKGKIAHELELIEMDFLKKNGIDVNYNDIECHIEKIIDKFENDIVCDFDNMDGEEISDALQDLEDKTNGIESASCTLARMRKIIRSMRKSDTKETLLSCVDDIEQDLNL